MPPSVLSRHEGADRLGEFINENGGGPGPWLRSRHQKKSQGAFTAEPSPAAQEIVMLRPVILVRARAVFSREGNSAFAALVPKSTPGLSLFVL
jgi:hypothetical protein